MRKSTALRVFHLLSLLPSSLAALVCYDIASPMAPSALIPVDCWDLSGMSYNGEAVNNDNGYQDKAFGGGMGGPSNFDIGGIPDVPGYGGFGGYYPSDMPYGYSPPNQNSIPLPTTTFATLTTSSVSPTVSKATTSPQQVTTSQQQVTTSPQQVSLSSSVQVIVEPTVEPSV
jgi:hypothetical protein